MLIRPGTAADRAAAVDVLREAETAAGQPPSADRRARVTAKVDSDLLVVAEDGDVIGMASGEPLRLDDGHPATVPGGLHLSLVAVRPHRQRQGVGSALVEGLADEAFAAGYQTMWAWSTAPEFYQACGLEPTGRTSTLPDGRLNVQLSAELEAPARELVLEGSGIRLGQLLKFAGLADTGAEAKALLAAGEVEVNREVETRRGRQLHDGDEVRAHGAALVLRSTPPH